MLAALGETCPAVGFAAGVERLLLALARHPADSPASGPAYIAWAAGQFPAALQAARRLRTQGRAAAVALAPSGKEEAARAAQDRELFYIES
jgi:histidyl-tRNA synthetase